MKKRINRAFILIALLAICMTTALITVVYYNLFQNQVTSDLKDYTVLVREMGEDTQFEQLGGALLDREIRLTLVDPSGKVLYDNEVDSNTLENHMDRPEIRDAFEKGEGQSMRNSQTLSHNTFYYAVRLDNGSVLRVAKDAGSIISVFSSVVPTIMWILAALILLSLGMAHMLTRKLIEPIENLAENMDAGVQPAVYDELAPFIQMIQEQHQDILKNAQMRRSSRRMSHMS